MTRARCLPLLLAAAVSTGGCETLTPQAAAFQKINETYTREWVELRSPRPAEGPTADCRFADALGIKYRPPGNKPAFGETLALIEQFRADYPHAQKEQTALVVREGIIYLESGQVGLARLKQEAVVTAGQALTSEGASPRDALLGRAFPYRIDGWKPIIDKQNLCRDMEREPPRDQALARKYNNDPRQISADYQGRQKAFASAADGIANLLHKEKAANRLKLDGGDGGARHLSVEAATFYLWADRIAETTCGELHGGVPDGQVQTQKPFCARYFSADYLVRARQVIEANASSDERQQLAGMVEINAHATPGPAAAQQNTFDRINRTLECRPFEVRDLKERLTTQCAEACAASLKALVDDASVWPADLPSAATKPDACGKTS